MREVRWPEVAWDPEGPWQEVEGARPVVGEDGFSRPLHVRGAERLRGKEVPVLDHGKVVPVDRMGSDAAVCEAARAFDSTMPVPQSPLPVRDERAWASFPGFFVGDGFAGGTAANSVAFHLKKDRK